jgi:hypothetical protein
MAYGEERVGGTVKNYHDDTPRTAYHQWMNGGSAFARAVMKEGESMEDKEESIYDSMAEINRLAQRIEELSKPFTILPDAIMDAAGGGQREETTEKMYAVGDTYAPRDGFYASPFYKLEKAQEVVPVSPPPNTFFIWECKDDGGYVAVARWDEVRDEWVMLDNAAGGMAGVTPCS